MDEETLWQQRAQSNPEQAKNYIKRFAQLRAQGVDLDGEARFIDALLPRGARVLDAGCGTGRVGGALARLGHRVTGVDLDEELLSAAAHDFPDARWIPGNLASFELRVANGGVEEFDVVFAAGNVLAFVAPGTQAQVLNSLARHLAPEARLVLGFSPSLGYAPADFAADVRAAGLEFTARFSTWDMRPADPDADFIVALLQRTEHVN